MSPLEGDPAAPGPWSSYTLAQASSRSWVVIRECKTPNVPTFSALRKKQASMTYKVDIKSMHHTSSLGNHFYMNHLSKLLALDWANPLVRPFIHIYPEVSGPISEFWQASKWTSEISLEELSPMWADWGNKVASHWHFYRDGCFHIKTGGICWIPAQSLAYNYLDLQASLESIQFTDYSPFYQMPHPLREKAQGQPIFRLRVMPWSDNVSSNVSKQYNAHTNMYVMNLNLPHQKLAQEYFVRFVSTSTHALSSEHVLGAWHEAYDCELEQEILFEIIPHVLPADNPQQSETASHIGMGGNLGCRRALTGGSKEQQESDHGYRALYAPSVPHDKMGTASLKGDTRKAVKQEILRRIQLELWDWVVSQPNESFLLLSVDDRLDPHQDTPVKILHTYLLGKNKYDDKKEGIFAAQLTSSSIQGLSIPPPRPRYIVQYKNLLIGKHFKMLQQLRAFHVHDLCPLLLFDLWKATGELGAHLWFPKIGDMEQYLLHTLPHLPDDVRQFGPAILYATEIFECWNAIFCLCSIFSNHLAPSRNIAATLADMEQFKHVVSGGWWKNAEGIYIRAGSHVRAFLKSNKELQRRLGWSEKSLLECGTVKLESSVKRRHTTLASMVSADFPIAKPALDGALWVVCKSVVAQSGDDNHSPQAGCISKIISQERDGKPTAALILVETFIVSDLKDRHLNMPILLLAKRGMALEIMFEFNAQHDCFTCDCAMESVPILQERIHSLESQFILNIHALHNAHSIQEVLPQSLTSPVPYLQDRLALHTHFAEQLQITVIGCVPKHA
ncbi:hypothetical protein B0H14DRAFT_3094462 [Mycena olivaceomarginata]|nr:hypothetical protein B0H14DRAFT_3094462 [Mycena olivaceomarginata]